MLIFDQFQVSVVAEPDASKLNIPSKHRDIAEPINEKKPKPPQVPNNLAAGKDVYSIINDTYDSLETIVSTSYPPSKGKISN